MSKTVHQLLCRGVLCSALGFAGSGCDPADPAGKVPDLAADDSELRHGQGSYSKVPQPSDSYTLFETLQVRPLALSPDGKRLFALNTPDNRLEIYKIGLLGLRHESSVSVGLEPIALAARSNDEVWVVNHLSDSVSIVDVSRADPAVVRTLWVGDEPRDIVFAGPEKTRAFVSTAHRGQNSPDDP